MKKIGVFFLLAGILFSSCKTNYSHYQEPRKPKHTYTGKKDRWMDLKRDDLFSK